MQVIDSFVSWKEQLICNLNIKMSGVFKLS